MNILPKKSWHVRTRKNIERVRRDEAEAERVAIVEQNRVLQAEREARTRELQLRAGHVEPQTHINLFQDLSEHRQDCNHEHEEERKRDDESWQQRVGILNKLVRFDDVNKPWYCGPSGVESSESTSNPEKGIRKKSRCDLITSIYDPMTAIKDAERIVLAKRKRLQEERQRQIKECTPALKQLDYYQSTRPPRMDLEATIPPRRASKLVQILESDSSPEIVKEVRVSKSSRHHKKNKHRKHSHGFSRHHRDGHHRNKRKKHSR